MVQFVKPVVRSEDMIDLSTKSGAAGRATNRLIRNRNRQAAAARDAEMLQEVLLQAMKARAKRKR